MNKMKLIKFAAVAALALGSLSANAGLLTVSGDPMDTSDLIPVSPANDFIGDIGAPTKYWAGRNLVSESAGSLYLEFSFLGEEAGWRNEFFSGSGMINNEGTDASFGYTQSFAAGEEVDFDFASHGLDPVSHSLHRYISNGANNTMFGVINFAIALNTTFKGVAYDAILFLDDTGYKPDDDNHDDLIIGIKARVPEPSTVVLMLMGLAGLFGARRLKA
jgi:hypothetical protein